ncbi:MAG TPA: histidine phosphatase family protein [Caulobacteraceae bacterium]|nr:histidine phosphatase family protein [Caulobacteraceae bacterium]
MVKVVAMLCAVVALINSGAARADALPGPALVSALRQGGYVMLMRHASSPRTLPTASEADPDNVKLERQLDETGRDTARAMGTALKTLRIPVGAVWSSPTYRALETVRVAALPTPRTAVELGDGGQSMQATAANQSAWLARKVAEPPRVGTDTIIVTHMPNIMALFGQAVAGLADGETLVLRPDSKGGTEIVGRVKISDWPVLAAQP